MSTLSRACSRRSQVSSIRTTSYSGPAHLLFGGTRNSTRCRRPEAAADLEHGVCGPDRGGVLGEARDLLRAHVGAGGDDQLVVAEPLSVLEPDHPRVRVHLGDPAAVEADVPAAQWLLEVDQQ